MHDFPKTSYNEAEDIGTELAHVRKLLSDLAEAEPESDHYYAALNAALDYLEALELTG